jgi:hypothetical protein
VELELHEPWVPDLGQLQLPTLKGELFSVRDLSLADYGLDELFNVAQEVCSACEAWTPGNTKAKVAFMKAGRSLFHRWSKRSKRNQLPSMYEGSLTHSGDVFLEYDEFGLHLNPWGPAYADQPSGFGSPYKVCARRYGSNVNLWMTPFYLTLITYDQLRALALQTPQNELQNEEE